MSHYSIAFTLLLPKDKITNNKQKTMVTQRITDLAKDLGVTLQTVRNYTKYFSDYLSSSAVKAAGKRYTVKDVEILTRVNQLRNDGFGYADIMEKLPPIVEILEDGPQEQGTQGQRDNPNAIQLNDILPILEQQANSYQETIKAKDETIRKQDETIDELKKDKSFLQDELKRKRRWSWNR